MKAENIENMNFLAHPSFNTADDALDVYYDAIVAFGHRGIETRSLFNIGFYINNPGDRLITQPWRKWNESYAEREWDWYMSGDRSVAEIKKHAKIWDSMHSGDNIVNSNYGWQWNRNGQLENVIRLLKQDIDNYDSHSVDRHTRQAYLTIHDGKEHKDFKYDTPCTLSIGFNTLGGVLNMNVHMRSNDLIYGFCNDQYCFSMLQELVADELDLQMGCYFHIADNLHIYKRHFELKDTNRWINGNKW